MKKKLFYLLAFISYTINAQVAIGKNSISNDSVSLEFGAGNRGIILPYVNSAASVSNVTNGTLIFDSTDKKVKVKYNSGWKDLSVREGSADLSIQQAKEEFTSAKTIIGNASGTTAGILVLEDTSRAMILPKVNQPHLNIVNPAVGMIAYDTSKKQLAVFNGSVWSFWSAAN